MDVTTIHSTQHSWSQHYKARCAARERNVIATTLKATPVMAARTRADIHGSTTAESAQHGATTNIDQTVFGRCDVNRACEVTVIMTPRNVEHTATRTAWTLPSCTNRGPVVATREPSISWRTVIDQTSSANACKDLYAVPHIPWTPRALHNVSVASAEVAKIKHAPYLPNETLEVMTQPHTLV